MGGYNDFVDLRGLKFICHVPIAYEDLMRNGNPDCVCKGKARQDYLRETVVLTKVFPAYSDKDSKGR